MMITELYDALKDAGASEDKARKAAEEVAGYEKRLSSIQSRLAWLTGATSITSVAVIAILISQFALWQQIGSVTGSLTQISGQLTHITELLERRMP